MNEPTRIGTAVRTPAARGPQGADRLPHGRATPRPSDTPALVRALERGGADLIELGVPFSDPVADGPVIQRGQRARAQGRHHAARGAGDRAARSGAQSEVPLLLFTYLNPVLRYGLEALARDAAAAGIDGCLLTDLSVEEARRLRRGDARARPRHRVPGRAHQHARAG